MILDLIVEIIKWLSNKEIIRLGAYLRINVRNLLKIETELDLTNFTDQQVINLCRDVKLESCLASAVVFKVEGNYQVSGKLVNDLINKIPNIKQLSIGYYHSLALTRDNKVYGIGSNYSNQFDESNIKEYSKPVLIYEQNIKLVASGYYCSLFVDVNDEIYLSGKLQVNVYNRSYIGKIENIIKITFEAYIIYILTKEGQVYAIGQNYQFDCLTLIDNDVTDISKNFYLKDGNICSRNPDFQRKAIKIAANYEVASLDAQGNFCCGKYVLKEIVQISSIEYHFQALNRDGLVYQVRWINGGQPEILTKLF